MPSAFSNSTDAVWTLLRVDENENPYIYGIDPRFSLPGKLGQSRDVKLDYPNMNMTDLVDINNKV